MSEKVTITRHWHNPLIHTRITDQEIELEIDLKDFFMAFMRELNLGDLKKEFLEKCGSVTFVLRDKTYQERIDSVFRDIDLEKRVEIAFKSVLRRIKEESSKVA